MIFNLVSLLFVVVFIGIGSKKGFIRELMALIGLCTAIVITTGKLDFIAVEIAGAIDASPLAVSIIAYIIVLGLMYGIFKVLARVLYKVVSPQSLGQQDKYGGALIGAVRGWFVAGTLLFLTILMPLPRVYFDQLDQSVLAKNAARSIQLLYDTSSPMHKTWPPFLDKVELSLTSIKPEDDSQQKYKKKRSADARLKDELALRAAVEKVNFFFGDAEEF